MEKLYFALPGYRMALLQIGQNCSRIEMTGELTGSYSYGVCGKDVILYLVNDDDEVVGLVLNGGYINRIKTSSLGVMVEVFTRRAGANPDLVTKDFHYEWVDVL